MSVDLTFGLSESGFDFHGRPEWGNGERGSITHLEVSTDRRFWRVAAGVSYEDHGCTFRELLGGDRDVWDLGSLSLSARVGPSVSFGPADVDLSLGLRGSWAVKYEYECVGNSSAAPELLDGTDVAGILSLGLSYGSTRFRPRVVIETERGLRNLVDKEVVVADRVGADEIYSWSTAVRLGVEGSLR